MNDSELIDRVNEDDHVICSVTRKDAHTYGFIHRSVMFYLFDRLGRVYVNQRTGVDKKDFYPSYWSIVFGGHVSAGQDYDEAVVREADEEGGVKDQFPIYIASFKKRFDQNDRENVCVYGFILDKELELDPTEIVQGLFMGIPELENKLTEVPFLPETQTLCKILKENYHLIEPCL